MFQLVIIRYDDDPSHRLVRWAQFHRIPYTFYETGKVYEYSIFVTSNVVPSTHIFSYIFKRQSVSTNIVQTKIGGKWRKTFCMVISGPYIRPTEDTILDNSIQATLQPGNYFTMILEGTLSRTNGLWSIIMNDWYKRGEEHVSKYYYPLWIEACHKEYIETKRIDKNWMKEQTCFAGLIERTKMESPVYTMQGVEKLIQSHEITFEDCFNGLKGYEVSVNITHALLALHPFSTNGIFKLIPTRKSNIDLSITLVGFYYDLGYDNKKKEGYYESLKYYAALEYPIVFYGEEEVCLDFLRMRGELAIHTKTVIKKVNEWNLIREYESEFAEMDTHLDFRFRRRYALLTCNKVYAVMEAIAENPFYSQTFVWFDPGMYRHPLARLVKTEEHPLQNVDFTLDKFVVLSFNVVTGSTHEEFRDGHESIISSIMGGSQKAWKDLFKVYNTLVTESFSRNFFVTEQVMFTRLVGLYPDLFRLLDFSYLDESLKRVLKL